MILHVLRAARAARRLDHALVATEDERIAAIVRDAGGEAILTSPQAASGTDRLAEAARSVAADVYVNIQGDEPMMSPENVDRAVETLTGAPGRDIATLAVPMPAADARDPNNVKVAVARDGHALYFSRSPIPYFRSGEPSYRKISSLCYRAATLQELAALRPPLSSRILGKLRYPKPALPSGSGSSRTRSGRHLRSRAG